MPKKPNLAEAFKVDQSELQPKPDVVELPTTPEKSTKSKKRHIGGHFDESVYRQMKIVGAEKGLTTQEILAEALNAFFRMHDKPPIA
jgi:hypothetical protein